MTDTQPTARPDFFGKDGFTSFIGVVEDVNDPKRSGRVKVRCIGWHPKDKTGEGGLKTEDLPWARVGMPTTHAQQSRLGGKHGLLPGVWVWGFFIDGEEAQQPFIVSTFNFTAKSTEEDFRDRPRGEDGTMTESDLAFDKNEVSPKTQPNISTRTPSEQGERGYKNTSDPSGDVPADESFDSCTDTPSRESAASVRRQKTDLSDAEEGNPESQLYSVPIADGLCGTDAHARDDVKRKLKERMPSSQARFTYGDAVWNKWTGQFMELNGIFSQLALEMASIFKQPSNSVKAAKETENRKDRCEIILEKPDRDGVERQERDKKSTEEHDLFHAIFQEETIDTLYKKMAGILRGLNNAGSGGNGGGSNTNLGADVGAQSQTQISNTEATCLTDQILVGVDDIVERAILSAVEKSKDESNSIRSGNIDFSKITSILGSLTDIMQFPLTQKYSQVLELFNREGDRSQDVLTKEQGCLNERDYNTQLGTLASLMGLFDGGGLPGMDLLIGSSGHGSGGSDDGGLRDLVNVAFGGAPREVIAAAPQPPGTVCEDATAIRVPDPGYGDDQPGGSGISPLQPRPERPNLPSPENPNGLPFPGDGGGGTSPGNPPGTVPDEPFDPENPETPPVDVPVDPNNPATDPNAPTPTDPTAPGASTPTNPNIPSDDPYNPSVGTGTGLTGITTEVSKYAQAEVYVSVPKGYGAIVYAASLPASTTEAAQNFIDGVPNQLVVIDAGRYYFYNNQEKLDRVFPSIYIPGYAGIPTPVVDRKSGELVAVLSNPALFDDRVIGPNVTVIPDDSPSGIVTDDPRYNIRLAGFMVENTGFQYTNPTITITDKDTEQENGRANVIIRDGRVVEIEITDTGNFFQRIPDVHIQDETGFGCKVRPIMSVTARTTENDDKVVIPEDFIFCPSKNLRNLS